MAKYIKFLLREFLDLNNDYESLLANQNQILEQLKEVQQIEFHNPELIVEEKKESYKDYLTLKNILLILIGLGFLGGGIWLYSHRLDFFQTGTLESLQSLNDVSKNLNNLNQSIDALKKLNEDYINLSEKEIQLLLGIKKLLLNKGIDTRKILNKPMLSVLQTSRNRRVTWWDEQD